jgi:hypothetical protein
MDSETQNTDGANNMTNASTIIAINSFYSNCSSDELHDSIRLALNIERDSASTAADRWEARLVITTIQDLVAAGRVDF